MKRIVFLFLLIPTQLILGQNKSILTTKGKKVTFETSYIKTADNGLYLSTPNNVRLGGILTKPSVLTTTSAFTLALKGLVAKGSVDRSTDNVLMVDESGTLKKLNVTSLEIEPWYNAVDNNPAWQNTQNIYTMGNVGVGQAAAARTLDIKRATAGAVKIADGTQAANYILTTNQDGLATWRVSQPEVRYVKGTLPQTQINLDSNTTAPTYFGSSIDLPPGNWSINVGIVIGPKIGLTTCEINNNYLGRFILSDKSDVVSEASFSYATPNKWIYSISSTGPSASGYALYNTGRIRITTTEALTRLYLLSTERGNAIGSVKQNSLENFFYALRIE